MEILAALATETVALAVVSAHSELLSNVEVFTIVELRARGAKSFT